MLLEEYELFQLNDLDCLRPTRAAAHTNAFIGGTLSDVTSHHARRRPGRRRLPTRVSKHCPLSALQFYTTLTLLLLSCCTVTFAQVPHAFDGNILESTLEKLARRGEILIDRSPPPDMSHLQRRQDEGGSPFGTSTKGSAGTPPPPSTSAKGVSSMDSTPATPESTHEASPESTEALTPTSSSAATSTGLATDPSATSLPTPFDTSLGANFTSQTCPEFFQTFLANKQFQQCLPFSQLLQNSNSFFQVEKSGVRTTQTLDATCAVNFNACSSLMGSLARQLRSEDACGDDFRLENPNVLQAYNGFLAYQPLYQAGCLKSTTGSYCFADAITNASSPSDSYIYYLPLGINLPGGSRPTCDKCLSDTMAIFRTSAGNSSQPLSLTYSQAAQQIQINCGPTFVNSNVVPSSAPAIFQPHNSMAILTATASFLLYSLLF